MAVDDEQLSAVASEAIFSPITPSPKTRLAELISREIEERIVQGDLRPGDALPPERELARQLAVSRPSLREALLNLRSRGIISVRRNSGYTIGEATSPSLTDPLLRLMQNHPKAVSDVLELRQGLETLTAALAALRATPSDIKRMETTLENTEAAHRSGDAAAAAEWDARFHVAIADATHNVALVHVMRGLFTVMRENVRRAREAIFQRSATENPLHSQHRALVEAIRAGDPEAAVHAAEEHLAYIRHGITESTKNH